MKIRVDDLLAILADVASPTRGTLGAVERLVHLVLPLFGPGDQARLQQALAEAMATNDEGHARLQAKLAAAKD